MNLLVRKFPRGLNEAVQQFAFAFGGRVNRNNSALDPELVGEVLNTIKLLAKEGTTMLIVTHEMRFARDVAHRTIFMDGGLIAEQGPSAKLFRNPKNARLKEFLKRANI